MVKPFDLDHGYYTIYFLYNYATFFKQSDINRFKMRSIFLFLIN